MSSPVLPSLLVSTRLPTFSELQAQIQRLTEQLSVYQSPTNQSVFRFVQAARIKKQLDEKTKQLNQLQNPTDQSGVPPAPDASAILGPRIETPKVGIDDLKINLPSY